MSPRKIYSHFFQIKELTDKKSKNLNFYKQNFEESNINSISLIVKPK